MTDKTLPIYSTEIDPGSSFIDFLRMSAPHALPQVLPEGEIEIPHATTVCAIRYDKGVVIAGDRRATAGLSIASRTIEKVFQSDEYSAVAIAGAAGPAVEMVKLFQVQLEHYEKVEGEQLSLEGKANQLSALVRGNLGAAMQGFAVIPLFAGFDHKRERGRVYSFDVTGGRYEEFDYHANGSGGPYARNWIKSHWREDMSRDEAIELALRSLFAAADEDAGTGGPDLVRKIFPVVATIESSGYERVTEGDVEARAQSLLGGPEVGGQA